MNLNYTKDELAFQEEVRQFLRDGLPTDVAHKVKHYLALTKDDHLRWHKALSRRGWLGVNWPVEYGGTGWTAIQRHIFDEECSAHGAPVLIAFGIHMVAPVLMKFGSESQKAHYLPRILNLDDWWCQGYSEPGSGSDLASLSTRAIRDGDHYIVNGQKAWTTLGHFANMIFCLVRTDNEVKAQEGISFLLIDMQSPGVSVRPTRLASGEHEVNEIWFENVKVPVANLVGEENRGWTYAKYLLTHERTNLAAIGQTKALLAHLKFVATEANNSDLSLMKDPLFRARVSQVEIELMALEMTTLRVLAEVHAGGAPGAESSMLKIKGTEIRQEIADLARRALGPYAVPFIAEALHGQHDSPLPGPDYANPLAARYFNFRKMSIYGGSNEIQKNIIAKQVLGL